MKNERVISLGSTDNLRELGGYKTADGRTIKWHKLLRSGSLGHLTKKDLEFLVNYGVRYDVDLRSDPEVASDPDQIDGTDIKFIYDPVANDDNVDREKNDADSFRKFLESTKNYGYDHMVQGYREKITSKTSRKAYHELFMILLKNKGDNQSVLFHCAAGKDRTGMAAFFILYALGVDLDTIKKDYILTNEVVKDVIKKTITKYRKAGLSEEALDSLRALYSVNIDYLNASLDEIDKQYGSVDKFLSEGLNLTKKDINDLRNICLE